MKKMTKVPKLETLVLNIFKSFLLHRHRCSFLLLSFLLSNSFIIPPPMKKMTKVPKLETLVLNIFKSFLLHSHRCSFLLLSFLLSNSFIIPSPMKKMTKVPKFKISLLVGSWMKFPEHNYVTQVWSTLWFAGKIEYPIRILQARAV